MFFVVGGLGFGALVAFAGLAWAFGAAVLAQIFNFITTGLAGIFFPYTKRDMFRASPASRWMVGKLPFVVICGLVTLISQLVLLYTFVAIPGVGISNPSELALVFIVIAFGIFYYLGVKWYRKTRQGIDLGDLFGALPPE
jgi:amino acid transporter